MIKTDPGSESNIQRYTPVSYTPVSCWKLTSEHLMKITTKFLLLPEFIFFLTKT